ncbi:MAG: hypothetical protein JXR07_19210 [Reichenbachiella sp.]
MSKESRTISRVFIIVFFIVTTLLVSISALFLNPLTNGGGSPIFFMGVPINIGVYYLLWKWKVHNIKIYRTD